MTLLAEERLLRKSAAGERTVGESGCTEEDAGSPDVCGNDVRIEGIKTEDRGDTTLLGESDTMLWEAARDDAAESRSHHMRVVEALLAEDTGGGSCWTGELRRRRPRLRRSWSGECCGEELDPMPRRVAAMPERSKDEGQSSTESEALRPLGSNRGTSSSEGI